MTQHDPRSSARASLQSHTWTRQASHTWTRQASHTWTRQASHTWTRRAVATVGLALSALLPTSQAFAAVGTPIPTQAYVVRATPAGFAGVESDLGRSVLRRLPLITADVARLSLAQAAAWRRDPRIVELTRDAAVSLQSSGGGQDAGAVQSLDAVKDATHARGPAGKALDGRGVDVALVDSGVARVPGLRGRVVSGPDLSLEAGSEREDVDGFGHGTHLAGIIVGGGDSQQGLAPGARLVSVKVADRNGNADVSQVIAGISWVVENAHTQGRNIRVLNLSFGTDSDQDYVLDPLAFAAEAAWRAGIVVVVSGGNGGRAAGGLTDPASDPYVLAVAASDTSKDGNPVATFSSRGDGTRNPDLMAPGAHVSSLRAPGSTIDRLYGDTARTDDGRFTGSGTSQAAAVVSGLVAQLVQARPGLSPDEVKAALTSTAVPVHSFRPRAQGHGLVDLEAALSADVAGAQQDFTRSTGTGTLEGARGTAHLGEGNTRLAGEVDAFGRAVDTTALARAEQDRSAWRGSSYLGTDLVGADWATRAWTAGTFGSTTWASTTWASTTWASTTWASTTWASTTWS